MANNMANICSNTDYYLLMIKIQLTAQFSSLETTFFVQSKNSQLLNSGFFFCKVTHSLMKIPYFKKLVWNGQV